MLLNHYEEKNLFILLSTKISLNRLQSSDNSALCPFLAVIMECLPSNPTSTPHGEMYPLRQTLMYDFQTLQVL